jgi:hypothetical protein
MLSRRSENPDGKEDSFEKEQLTISYFISRRGPQNGTVRIKVVVRNRRG